MISREKSARAQRPSVVCKMPDFLGDDLEDFALSQIAEEMEDDLSLTQIATKIEEDYARDFALCHGGDRNIENQTQSEHVPIKFESFVKIHFIHFYLLYYASNQRELLS